MKNKTAVNILVMLLVLGGSLVSRAEIDHEAIQRENTEGKILASMIQYKSDAIKSIHSMIVKMMKDQDIIAESPSQGRLSASGQLIFLAEEKLKEVQKLDADKDFSKIQDSVKEVAELKKQVNQMLTIQ